jgi:hypothetical protein
MEECSEIREQGLHVCQGLIKIGKSGSLSSSFFALVLARSLLGWLAVYPPSSHAAVRFGFLHRLGKSWSFSSSTFRRPTITHCPNLAISRLLVHVVGNGSAPHSIVYHFSYTNVSCQIQSVSVISIHITESTLTCSILAMVTFSMLQLYHYNIL